MCCGSTAVCGQRDTHALVDAFSAGYIWSLLEAAIASRLFVTMAPHHTPARLFDTMKPPDTGDRSKSIVNASAPADELQPYKFAGC